MQAALMGQAADAEGLVQIGENIAAANAEKLLEVGLTAAEVRTLPLLHALHACANLLPVTGHLCSA